MDKNDVRKTMKRLLWAALMLPRLAVLMPIGAAVFVMESVEWLLFGSSELRFLRPVAQKMESLLFDWPLNSDWEA